jgi:DNA invertase Pin-like site-specific DNA recombinase
MEILKKPKVVIYGRLSSKTELSEIRKFCSTSNYNIEHEFSPHIIPDNKQEDFMATFELMDYLKENDINKVVIYDCSRLSRSVPVFVSTVKSLAELGVSLLMMKEQFETMTEGVVNPTTKLICDCMMSFHLSRVSILRKRLESGYTNYRKHHKVGRKVSYRKSDAIYREQYQEQIEMLRRGYSLTQINRKTSTAINSLRNLKKYV